MRTRRNNGGLLGPRKCTNSPGSTNNDSEMQIVNDGCSARTKKRRGCISLKNSNSTHIAAGDTTGEGTSSCGTLQEANHSSSKLPDDQHCDSARIDEAGLISDDEIMKIDTQNYCLFCLKLTSSYSSKEWVGVNGGTSENIAGTRKEICSRYLKLLTRYLKLDISRHFNSNNPESIRLGFFAAKCLRKDEKCFEINACDSCFKFLSSFCDLYHRQQQIQLQLNWNVIKLRDIMRSAEKVPSRSTDFRKNVLEGKDAMKKQEKMLLDAFKREFYQKSAHKRFPKLVLRRFKGKEALNVEKSKPSRTILLQSCHERRNDEIMEEEKPSKVRSVQVLKIGQELRLTSRGLSHDSNTATSTRNTTSGIANSGIPCPIQEQERQDGTLTPPAKQGQRILPSRDDPSTPPQAKSVLLAPAGQSNIIPRSTCNSTTSLLQRREQNHSTLKQRSRKPGLQELRKPIKKRYIPHKKGKKIIRLITLPLIRSPSSDSSTHGPCEVIDLCESDNEAAKDDADIDSHSPAKKGNSSLPMSKVGSMLPPAAPQSQSENKRKQVQARDRSEAIGGQSSKSMNMSTTVSEPSHSPPPAAESRLPTMLQTKQQGSCSSISSNDLECGNPPNAVNPDPSPPTATSNHDANVPQTHAADLNGDCIRQQTESFVSTDPTVNNFTHPSRIVHPEEQQFIPPVPPLEHTDQFNDFNLYNSHEATFAQTSFELPIPTEEPGAGIEVTLNPPEDPEVCTTTVFTVTRTFTSTITHDGPIMDENFGIPSVFPPFNSMPIFDPPPQDHSQFEAQFQSQSGSNFDHSFDCNSSNNVNDNSYNVPTQNFYHPTSIPTSVEPQCTVTEADDNDLRYANASQNNVEGCVAGGVEISEVIDDDSGGGGGSNEVEITSDDNNEVIFILQSNVNQSAEVNESSTHVNSIQNNMSTVQA